MQRRGRANSGLQSRRVYNATDQERQRTHERRGRDGGVGQGRGGRRGGARGGGRGGRARSDEKLARFSFRNLQKMAENDPDTLVLDMASEKCLPAVENLVSDIEMDDEKVVLVLKVFCKASQSTTVESFVVKLLSHLPKSTFMNFHLSSYINRMVNNCSADIEERENQLRMMVGLFTELLIRLPSCYAVLPIAQLFFAVTTLNNKGELLDASILPSIEELAALKDEKAEKVKQEDEARRNRPRRRNRRDVAAQFDNEQPPEDFRDLSVIPTHEDVHRKEAPFLRTNKVDGSYDNPEHYLDVQFRLLREDFVRPLRDGINELLTKMTTHKMGPLQDIRVYHKVRILFPVFTSKGLIHKVSFDNSRMKNINWENSKRLIYGSLLCLSKDNFETFILATVENRDTKELQEGRVDVRFTSSLLQTKHDKDVYEMVETTAYFEAYRHVLEGLKEIDAERIPFQRYIVQCSRDTRPPAYLRNRLRGVVTYDLTPIMKKTGIPVERAFRRMRLTENRDNDGQAVHILNMNAWPSAEDLQLDESQFKAVQLALTSEFALIQGPPGTGKTYIGLKVVRILLHNRDKWTRGTENELGINEADDAVGHRARGHTRVAATHPILVVCYTNHALDQFLEGIHEFHPEGIVRIGGRSQSETMTNCSLRELKHKMRKNREVPREINRAYFETHRELEHISDQMKNATENLQKCKEKLVHEKELVNASCMTKRQFTTLITDPQTGRQSSKAMMCYWLGLMSDNPFEQHVFLPPIAVFPFNLAAKRINLCNQHHVANIHNVKPAPGLAGNAGGSYELEGARNSYIYIPNMADGFLDTRQSMSIVFYLYPMSTEGGPIVCFQQHGLVGIEISQVGSSEGKGVLEASFNRRDGARLKPLSKAVLRLNQWNYIVASYDYETGIYRLWHDGRMVQQLQNMAGYMEIGSQFPVFIGSLNQKGHNKFFEGRICGFHIFPYEIGRHQILTMGGIREEDLLENEDINIAVEEEEQEELDEDTLFEAKAEQDMRVIDDDETTHFGEKKGKRTKLLMTADPFENENIPPEMQWQVQNPARKRKKIDQKIKRELSHGDMMHSRQAEQVQNVWELNMRDRWRLYRYWIDKLCESNRQTVESFQDTFEQGANKLNEIKHLEDQYVLEHATVIGMTTTGAAKHRSLIQKIKPRITIVEEAAEVLESHIVTSLTSGCQHLILIGDHQQLRPNPTVYDLAKNYQLDTSLFERMVNIGMRLERLNSQHRMRPEIAEMMSHIYKDLQNHESVMNFEHIQGVNDNIFFIEHNELEDYVEEGRSRSNIHEAKYLAALCRYFILQGYKRQQITILTMYTGQLIQLKKEMPRDFFRGVRICAVDNFQGEENDIILLSLVRSNEEGRIGFLRTSNRVCVALSRAKQGFYCIGNIELMCEKEKLWKDIIEDMRSKEKVGKYLTLTCHNHPKNIIHASCADDFKKAPEGGCMEPCAARLECGHVCRSVCHPGDPKHLEYKCRERCTKMLCKDHECKKLCWQECGKCTVLVSKEIPNCQHIQQVPCFKDPKEFHCTAPCLKKMSCGLHHCPKLCFQSCATECRTMVKRTLKCGHENTVPCYMDPEGVTCDAPCGELLTCDHPCKGTCGKCFRGRLHMPCKEKCARPLFCGHLCKEACTKNCPPCSERCQNKCVHSECKNKCGDPCVPCMMPCKWKCKHHQCTRRCGEPCDRPRCNRPCKEQLRCKHRCIGICGEPCPKKCRVCDKDEVTEIFFGDEDEPTARFVELQPCGHVIEVKAMDHYMDEADKDVTNIQLKGCPKCRTPIRTALRYGDIIKKTLADIEKVKAKLVLPDYKLELETKRLARKLETETIHKDLSGDKDKILEAISLKRLTTEQLNMYENQINFLCFLSEVISSIDRIKHRMSFLTRRVSFMVEESTKALAQPLRERIMMLRGRFSDQEKEEINDELLRFSLLTSHTIIIRLARRFYKSNLIDELEYISQVIDSEKRISKDDIDRYMKHIKELSVKHGLDQYYQTVTDQEKNMIVKAMGMAQGHWFKCPKGHIYCIGDCGGATEESKCPECGSAIGGRNHTLRGDNSLAGEMDGARHAAWSDFTNNMGNFDLDNL